MSAPLPQTLARGVAALTSGRWTEAVPLLEEVVHNPDLAKDPSLRDIRARACSLYAPALLESGHPHRAEAPCRDAIKTLRQLRDKAGLQEVRALQDRIVRAIAHDAEQAQRLQEMERVAATPLDALLDAAPHALGRVEVLIQKAHAHADTEDALTGRPIAARAVAEADALGDTRQRVLARLALARTDRARALPILREANDLAGDAKEFNLVATIARTADVLGVALTADLGPDGAPA